MSEPGPIDVDVDALEPKDFARMLVSRAVAGEAMPWAEIHWDAARYSRSADLTVQLVGFVEELLAALAAPTGHTSADLWRDLTLPHG